MRPLLALMAGACLVSAQTPDRSVAEWTLTMGGRVGVAGRSRIQDIAELPAGDIRLEVLDWGMNVDPPDLARLSGLTHLKELHLPGPLWNSNADGGRDGSRDLRYIAPIHTLEALTFSYHFLDRIRFKDDGLAEIKELANLRELALRQSGITGQALGPFKRLRALDATLTRFNDAGYAASKTSRNCGASGWAIRISLTRVFPPSVSSRISKIWICTEPQSPTTAWRYCPI